ncbi:MAG: hypothetical protein NVS3B20_26460 [Polyangiales bacterium]
MKPSVPPSIDKNSGSGSVARSAPPSAKKKASLARVPSEPPKRQPPRLDARTLGLRVGIPVAIGWIIAFFIRHWIAYVVAGVLTAAVLGVVIFALYFTRKTQRVASIVGDAKTKEERHEAIERIDREFKKGDAAATFAKAQLLMQEDPRAAMTMLESIDLHKVMPTIADEARAQRAMLHLMLGEPQQARPLADAIELSRHNDQKTKATLGAVICEAWARTGQAKKAVDILQLFDTEDALLVEARPGLLRAQVFAYGAVDDLKSARTAMHRLAKTDPRIVAGFAQKGVHPLLVKEAKKILERSGVMPRPQQMRGPMR